MKNKIKHYLIVGVYSALLIFSVVGLPCSDVGIIKTLSASILSFFATWAIKNV